VDSIEGGRFVAPESLDDLDSFLEAIHALFECREGEAEGLVLGDVPARAHAEDEASAAEPVDLGGHAGEQCGVAEGHGRDERAESDAPALLGDHGE